MTTSEKRGPPSATLAEKAAAFDRIARAYLDIPTGTPPIEQLRIANETCLAVVGREVQQLHPFYRTSPPHKEQ